MFELLLTIFLIPIFTIIILLVKFGFWLIGKCLQLSLWLIKTISRLLRQVVSWLWGKVVAWYRSRGHGQMIP